MNKIIPKIKLKRTSTLTSESMLHKLRSQYTVIVNGFGNGFACSYTD